MIKKKYIIYYLESWRCRKSYELAVTGSARSMWSAVDDLERSGKPIINIKIAGADYLDYHTCGMV